MLAIPAPWKPALRCANTSMLSSREKKLGCMREYRGCHYPTCFVDSSQPPIVLVRCYASTVISFETNDHELLAIFRSRAEQLAGALVSILSEILVLEGDPRL